MRNVPKWITATFSIALVGTLTWWIHNQLTEPSKRFPSNIPNVAMASAQMCENDAIIHLVKKVVIQTLEGTGTVLFTQLDEKSDIPEELLLASGLSPEHLRELKLIVEQASKDEDILGQTFQSITDQARRGKLLFCGMDHNCRLKNPDFGAFHATDPMRIDDGAIQVRQLRSFPYEIENINELKLELSKKEARSNLRGSSSGYVVVTFNFRNLSQRYPGDFNLFFRPYDEFLHELVHFSDIQLVRNWVLANETLKAKELSPSKLYQDHTFESAGITYLSQEFIDVFMEMRAYALVMSLTVARMQQAGVSPKNIQTLMAMITNLIFQSYFSKTVQELFEKKYGITQKTFFHHTNTFRADMLETIEYAKAISSTK